MNAEIQDMHGKICIVTGATAGIGQAAALMLAKRGATVVGVGRNPKKNKYSKEMLKDETGNPNVEYLLADLSSQKDIHNVAKQFMTRFDRLDVLINNAGATFGERQESADGIKLVFCSQPSWIFSFDEFATGCSRDQCAFQGD